MKYMEKLKMGQKIKTKRGYTGVFITTTIDGKNAYVILNGCTYSDEHWYDIVPVKDLLK